MTDPFAQYKLPIGLTDGVEISLDGTPATFKVRLPSNVNEDFNMELLSRMHTEIGADGQVKVDAVKFQRERKAMFFDQCIISASGLPDGMNSEEFFKQYPLAAKLVYERATELAAKADEEVEASLGKSETMPNGKASGGVSMSNMTRSSKKVSTSKRAAQNLAG